MNAWNVNNVRRKLGKLRSLQYLNNRQMKDNNKSSLLDYEHIDLASDIWEYMHKNRKESPFLHNWIGLKVANPHKVSMEKFDSVIQWMCDSKFLIWNPAKNDNYHIKKEYDIIPDGLGFATLKEYVQSMEKDKFPVLSQTEKRNLVLVFLYENRDQNKKYSIREISIGVNKPMRESIVRESLYDLCEFDFVESFLVSSSQSRYKISSKGIQNFEENILPPLSLEDIQPLSDEEKLALFDAIFNLLYNNPDGLVLKDHFSELISRPGLISELIGSEAIKPISIGIYPGHALTKKAMGFPTYGELQESRRKETANRENDRIIKNQGFEAVKEINKGVGELKPAKKKWWKDKDFIIKLITVTLLLITTTIGVIRFLSQDQPENHQDRNNQVNIRITEIQKPHNIFVRKLEKLIDHLKDEMKNRQENQKETTKERHR